MSDDEDFVDLSDRIGRRNCTFLDKECLDKNGTCSTSGRNLSTGSGDGKEGKNMEDKDAAVGGREVQQLDVAYLTASQHMVPTPPSSDSLDWLDDIEPSQTQQTASKRRSGCREEGRREVEEYDVENILEGVFVTPKVPLCRRTSRLFTSGNSKNEISSMTTSTPRRGIIKSQNEGSEDESVPHSVSMDLFDGLSSKDIFDDFSVSGLQAAPTCTSDQHVPAASAGEKNSSPTPQDCGELNGFDDMDDIDISVIAESDFEKDWNEETAETEADINLPVTSSPSVDFKSSGGNFFSEQDSTFQLNMGKRLTKKRVINAYLDSPSPDSEVKRSKKSQPHQLHVALEEERHPGITKEFPVILDSSIEEDDDFVLPKHKPTTRRRLVQSKSERTIPVANTDFIEEEAECGELEGSEEEGYSQEDLYDTEDSFINDNSMLTQHNHCKDGKLKSKKVGACDIQPVPVSPLENLRDDVFTRRRYHAGKSRYRMVFSQRYKLLHHYMAKADGGSTHERLKAEGSKRRDEWGDLSGSEAEEVNLLEEEEDDDWDEISKSLLEEEFENELSSEDVITNQCKKEKGKDVCVARGRKRARFFSDSEDDMGELCRTKIEDLPTRIKETVEKDSVDSSEELLEKEIKKHDEKNVRKIFDISQYRDVIISPELLVVSEFSVYFYYLLPRKCYHYVCYHRMLKEKQLLICFLLNLTSGLLWLIARKTNLPARHLEPSQHFSQTSNSHDFVNQLVHVCQHFLF